MSDNQKVIVTFGGFPALLLIAFIVLKFCNVITWSWWWVLSPVWIPIACSIIFKIILLVLFKYF